MPPDAARPNPILDARRRRFANDVGHDADRRVLDQRGPVAELFLAAAVVMFLLRGLLAGISLGLMGPIGGPTYALAAHLLHRDDAYWEWQDRDFWVFVWVSLAMLVVALVNLIAARWPAWVAYHFAIAMIVEGIIYLGAIGFASIWSIVEGEARWAVVGVVIAGVNVAPLTMWRAIARPTRWAASRRIRWTPLAGIRARLCPSDTPYCRANPA